MPELSRFYGIIICIYWSWSEHGAPHIHAYHGRRNHPEWSVVLTIREGRILAGRVPDTDIRLIREWMDLHRDELYDAWEAVSNSRKPKKIDPPRMS